MNPTQTVVEDTITEVDPFEQSKQALQEDREQPQRQLSKNEVLNEVLNKTKPFTKEQRAGGTQQTKSILDSFQQPVNETMDKTVSFNQQGAQAGLGGMRAQMAAQMGYGDMLGGWS